MLVTDRRAPGGGIISVSDVFGDGSIDARYVIACFLSMPGDMLGGAFARGFAVEFSCRCGSTMRMNWTLSTLSTLRAILLLKVGGCRGDVTTRRCAAWIDLRVDSEEPARRYARARFWRLVGSSSWSSRPSAPDHSAQPSSHVASGQLATSLAIPSLEPLRERRGEVLLRRDSVSI